MVDGELVSGARALQCQKGFQVHLIVMQPSLDSADSTYVISILVFVERIEQSFDGITRRMNGVAARASRIRTVIHETLLDGVGGGMRDWLPTIHLTQKPQKAYLKECFHF